MGTAALGGLGFALGALLGCIPRQPQQDWGEVSKGGLWCRSAWRPLVLHLRVKSCVSPQPIGLLVGWCTASPPKNSNSRSCQTAEPIFHLAHKRGAFGGVGVCAKKKTALQENNQGVCHSPTV